MSQEQGRSQETLSAKLEARRKRRQQSEIARLDKKALLDADDELKIELQRLKEEESLLRGHFAAGGKQGGAAGNKTNKDDPPMQPHLSG